MTVFGLHVEPKTVKMADRSSFQDLNFEERKRRFFSEGFRREKVREIDRGITTVSEVSRTYQVTRTAVYKWIHKYSRKYQKQERLLMESESDTKKIEALKARVEELERSIGRKQIELDFKDKMIELAEEEYEVDIKKKFGSKPSSGSGGTESHTPSS